VFPLNIYTQVGLLTLMWLVSKRSILIVQFANELQRAGRSSREALEKAAGVRLRPILVTTATMVLGVLPLVIASGSRLCGPQCDGTPDLHGAVNWHAVHAVRRARDVHVPGGGSRNEAIAVYSGNRSIQHPSANTAVQHHEAKSLHERCMNGGS